jgi:glycerophosphoryl diester phosphodiesterase
VDRTTEGKGRVEDLTLAELRALDAGRCASPGQGRGTVRGAGCRAGDPARFPFRGRGHRIPTVEEALAAVPRGALVALELKVAGAEEALAATVRASGRLPRVVVGSEYDLVAARLKQLLPDATHFFPVRPAACLAVAARLRLPAGCTGYDLLAVPRAAAEMDLTTRAVIDGAHARGVAVFYFIINDQAEMERLFRLGADGIFTDYPTRARRVMERLGAR